MQERCYASGFSLNPLPSSRTKDEATFDQLVKQPCTFCGLQEDEYIGIDRINNDPSIGYVQGNVQACCTTCNMMRQGVNVNDFLKMAMNVAQSCVIDYCRTKRTPRKELI